MEERERERILNLIFKKKNSKRCKNNLQPNNFGTNFMEEKRKRENFEFLYNYKNLKLSKHSLLQLSLWENFMVNN